MIQKRIDGSHARESTILAVDNSSSNTVAIPKIQVDAEYSEEDTNSDDSWQTAISATSVLDECDFRSFRAHYEGATGRFTVFSNGVRFVRSLKRKEIWRVLFTELIEMRKIEGNKFSQLMSLSDQLEIKSTNGRIFDIEGMKERDEAFNAVIAFSGLQWQSLQIRHNTRDQQD